MMQVLAAGYLEEKREMFPLRILKHLIFLKVQARFWEKNEQ